jgi:hypothetical protein
VKRRVNRFTLGQNEPTEKLVIELDRPMNNLIGVTFSLATSEFEEASQVIKIISGEIEPEPE